MFEKQNKADSGIRLLLSTREAAQALAVSERTLWGLAQQGDVPMVRFGRCVRYPIDGLKEWISRLQRSNLISQDLTLLSNQEAVQKLQQALKLISESIEDLAQVEKIRRELSDE